METQGSPAEVREEIIKHDLRYRRTMNIAWVACLIAGAFLIFQLGNYHGRIMEYREEHFLELLKQAQEDRISGLEDYAEKTGEPLPEPNELRDLADITEKYFLAALLWLAIFGGIWTKRQHSQWCHKSWDGNAACNCDGQWWKSRNYYAPKSS